jgi:hypothetical protein
MREEMLTQPGVTLHTSSVAMSITCAADLI